jgi:hypothetical protein
VDDLRFFGTERERVKYMADVKSKIKVTFEEPPVTEFVSIETHQCMKTNACELKMPRYFQKAAAAFSSFFPDGMKERIVPTSALDEKLVGVVPTGEEILQAKYLPFRQILGVLSYPASQCHFAMKYSISALGSRRGGWNKAQFEALLKVFECGVTTRDIGVIYSKGLNPHGDNTLCACADASLSLPRSHGCRITMMNGGAVLFKAKKQTLTAPSTVWSEMEVFYDQTTDVLGLRNLMAELGMFQQKPTPMHGDNESQQKIANNRVCHGATDREYSTEGTQKGGLNMLPGASPQQGGTLDYSTAEGATAQQRGATVPPNIYYSTRVLLALHFLSKKERKKGARTRKKERKACVQERKKERRAHKKEKRQGQERKKGGGQERQKVGDKKERKAHAQEPGRPATPSRSGHRVEPIPIGGRRGWGVRGGRGSSFDGRIEHFFAPMASPIMGEVKGTKKCALRSPRGPSRTTSAPPPPPFLPPHGTHGVEGGFLTARGGGGVTSQL